MQHKFQKIKIFMAFPFFKRVAVDDYATWAEVDAYVQCEHPPRFFKKRLWEWDYCMSDERPKFESASLLRLREVVRYALGHFLELDKDNGFITLASLERSAQQGQTEEVPLATLSILLNDKKFCRVIDIVKVPCLGAVRSHPMAGYTYSIETLIDKEITGLDSDGLERWLAVWG
jgi:hypothetical protein